SYFAKDGDAFCRDKVGVELREHGPAGDVEASDAAIPLCCPERSVVRIEGQTNKRALRTAVGLDRLAARIETNDLTGRGDEYFAIGTNAYIVGRGAWERGREVGEL